MQYIKWTCIGVDQARHDEASVVSVSTIIASDVTFAMIDRVHPLASDRS